MVIPHYSLFPTPLRNLHRCRSWQSPGGEVDQWPDSLYWLRSVGVLRRSQIACTNTLLPELETGRCRRWEYTNTVLAWVWNMFYCLFITLVISLFCQSYMFLRFLFRVENGLILSKLDHTKWEPRSIHIHPFIRKSSINCTIHYNYSTLGCGQVWRTQVILCFRSWMEFMERRGTRSSPTTTDITNLWLSSVTLVSI